MQVLQIPLMMMLQRNISAQSKASIGLTLG